MEIAREIMEAHGKLSLSEFLHALYADLLVFIEPGPGADVLELESGGGHLTSWWQARASAVTGGDPSQRGSSEVRRLLESCRLTRVKHGAAAEKLPFADETFDIVSAFMLFCGAVKAGPAFYELARVLKIGGVVGGIVPSVSLTPERIEEIAQNEGLGDDVVDFLLQVLQDRPGSFSGGQLDQLMLDAGLKAVRTSERLDGLFLLVKARR